MLLSRQYSAAKVPMLPVVVGEARTRVSILAYTILMLAISALPILWLGPVYAVACIALGAVFLWLAASASRRRDGGSAMALFHYSLAYLALLFVAAAAAAALPL